MIPKVTRLIQLPNIPHGLRNATRGCMAALWKIEGHNGIFYYDVGCKADRVTDEGIVAEVEGNYAIFKRDESVEFMVKQALDI